MPGSSGSLGPGKPSLAFLGAILARLRTVSDPLVRQGPGPGEDAAIISLPCCDLAVHTDPITEASERAGWLALNVAANDVATSGACPRWATVTMLLPENTSPSLALEIAEGIGRAAEKLGIDVVGGHTEATPGLSRPLLSVTVMGATCRGCALRTGDARPGDLVIVSGYAGMEGTGILASDFRGRLEKCAIPPRLIDEAERLSEEVSVVHRACRLAEEGLATAMHDATEGGVIGALVELGLASGLTVRADLSRVPLHPATRAIAECLGLDPYRLISSGLLVASVPRDLAGDALQALRESGLPAEVIGELVPGEPGLLVGGELIREPPADEILRVWSSGPEA